MNYSCGYFKTENDTLYEAPVNKTDYILKKLALEKGMSLLDVGCGWDFCHNQAARNTVSGNAGITSVRSSMTALKSALRRKAEHLLDVRLMDYRIYPKAV